MMMTLNRQGKRKQMPHSSLWHAAEEGSPIKVSRLLTQGKSFSLPEEDASGEFPLHIAAALGHTAVVAELLQHTRSHEQDLRDSNGDTALHCACYGGHLGVVQLLLNSGCERVVRNRAGKTAADLCEEFGHSSCAALVLGTPQPFMSFPFFQKSRSLPTHLDEAAGLDEAELSEIQNLHLEKMRLSSA